MLREYDMVVDNGADRLLSMIERSLDAEIQERREDQRHRRGEGRWGRWSALIALFGVLTFTYFVIASGHPTAGGILGGGGLAGLMALFITGKRA
jgi:uncharacterized membrane protein